MWALFVLLTATGLCLASAPHYAWRGVAALLAVAVGWSAGRVILGRGPWAVRRFEWSAEGRWSLVGLDGTATAGRLIGATVALGPWLLLAWSVETARGPCRSRRYALIDMWEVGQEAFRALRGRLGVQARGPIQRAAR